MMQTQAILTDLVKSNGIAKPSGILDLITKKVEVHSSVKITPKMAEELLTLNTHNRPLKKLLLRRLTEDMKDGRWEFCGNTIKFSNDLVLQDGQHSLMAVIKSGTTQTFNIQTGLSPESFTNMDTGVVRSAGDVLAIKGYHEHFALASAVKSLIWYRKHERLRTNVSYTVITNKQVDEFSESRDMKLMKQCIDFAVQMRAEKKGLFLAGSTWGFIYFVLSKVHLEQATKFVTMLAKGENISMTRHAAIYLLREQLINFTEPHIKELRAGGSFVTELKVKYVFRAWNAWRTGEKVTKLQIPPKDVKPEKPI